MKRKADVAPMKSTTTMNNDATIIVRVGGHDFRTSRQTLHHDGRGYFAALMQHQQPAIENVNRVYEVDRDPEPFRYVLSWMRSHRLAPAIAQDSRMLMAMSNDSPKDVAWSWVTEPSGCARGRGGGFR